MKGGLWWAFLGALLILAVLNQRGTLALLVLVLALASGASELWARHCLTNVTYRRRLGRDHLAYGEATTLTLEFTNAKPLPLPWLLVRDRYPAPVTLPDAAGGSGRRPDRGGRQPEDSGRPPEDSGRQPEDSGRQPKDSGRQPKDSGRPAGRPYDVDAAQGGALPAAPKPFLDSVVSLRWYERVTRTHRIRGDQRGYFRFGPAEISSGDMFGFRRRQRIDDDTDELIVYPRVVPVEALGLPAGRPLGEWLARRRVHTDPLRFAMVRDYAPGDNPRHVHWPASAHVGRLQTKQFDPSDTLALMLVVDVQTLQRTFEYVPEYLEYAITAAASIAMEALAQRHMVGLCANALGGEGQDWVMVRPGRHPDQARQLLTAMAMLSPFPGLSLAETLRRLRPRLPYGATVVAITARPGEEVYERLLALDTAGHGAILLTVGDEAPDVPETLRHHHLGGRDAALSSTALASAALAPTG